MAWIEATRADNQSTAKEKSLTLSPCKPYRKSSMQIKGYNRNKLHYTSINGHHPEKGYVDTDKNVHQHSNFIYPVLYYFITCFQEFRSDLNKGANNSWVRKLSSQWLFVLTLPTLFRTHWLKISYQLSWRLQNLLARTALFVNCGWTTN